MRPVYKSIELVSDVGDKWATFNVTTYNIHLLLYNMVSNIFISMSKYTSSDYFPLTLSPKNMTSNLNAARYIDISGASTRMTKGSGDWLVHTATAETRVISQNHVLSEQT